jgi:hypothetical protein
MKNSFKQWGRRISGLFQDTFLEREQTEVAIAVQLRIVEGLVREGALSSALRSIHNAFH